MYYQRECINPDGKILAKHPESSQVDGCLGRLLLLVRDIAVLEAFSQERTEELVDLFVVPAIGRGDGYHEVLEFFLNFVPVSPILVQGPNKIGTREGSHLILRPLLAFVSTTFFLFLSFWAWIQS